MESTESGYIEGWAHGTVVQVTGDVLCCSFEGYPSTNTKSFSRNDAKISPPGSRTGDWEWRKNLNKGDRLDAIDTQLKWYMSTVLNTRTEDGISEVYIGYRVYTPNGTKTDAENKRYEGWSTSYDIWYNTHSICIQPYSYLKA